MSPRPDPAAFLPLKPVDYEILFALYTRELHGYAMVRAIEERTDGAIRLEPSNLYRRVRALVRDGLVEEREERPAPELDDERRRYYGLTALGRSVLRAEAQRMRAIVADAEAARLLPAT